MNMTKFQLLQDTLTSTTGGKLYVCVECMPAGFSYKMKVILFGSGPFYLTVEKTESSFFAP